MKEAAMTALRPPAVKKLADERLSHWDGIAVGEPSGFVEIEGVVYSTVRLSNGMLDRIDRAAT